MFNGNFRANKLYLYILFVTDTLQKLQKKQINFSINFRTPTIINLPIIKKLTFPTLKAISVCFWHYLKTIPTGFKTVFTYASYDIPGENEVVVWIGVNNVRVSMRNKKVNIGNVPLKINVWTHMCWTWKMDGYWNLFVNAKLHAQGKY